MRKLIYIMLLVIAGSITASAQCGGTTTNLGLNLPTHGATNWDTCLNTNSTKLDSFLSGGTTLPSNLSIGGNLSVTGTITCSSGCGTNGTGAATQLSVWNGTTSLIGYAGLTTDSSGDLSALTLATTGTKAGLVGLTAGPDNVAACLTGQICDEAPTVVTKYTTIRAGAGPSVIGMKVYTALSSAETTESFTSAAPQLYEAGLITSLDKIYTNTQALTGGNATHTLANSFTFTGSGTFGCTCADQTAAAACKAVPASANTVTLAGTGSDVLWLSCSGH